MSGQPPHFKLLFSRFGLRNLQGFIMDVRSHSLIGRVFRLRQDTRSSNKALEKKNTNKLPEVGASCFPGYVESGRLSCSRQAAVLQKTAKKCTKIYCWFSHDVTKIQTIYPPDILL